MFLEEASFSRPELPGAWAPVLEELEAFMKLEAAIRERGASPSEDEAARLRELHDRLVELSGALLEERAIDDLSDADAERMFARSVLMVVRLRAAVLGESETLYLDTFESDTLRRYEPDFTGSEEQSRRIRGALERALDLDASELAAVEASVDRDLEDARRKHAVVAAIRDEFGLHRVAPDLSSRVFRLFQELYPEAPFLEGEVELILTATVLFFCVPYRETEIDAPRWETLGDDERRRASAFLERLEKSRVSQLAHFPVFGCFRGDAVDPDLVRRIAERSSLSEIAVSEELTTLVTVLPTSEVDKFVVHDVWGHAWQSAMLQFEVMYRQMATFGKPLGLSDAATIADGRRVSFGDCLDGKDGGFDAALFRAFVDAKIADRIPVVFSAALAEIVADVVEFKLIAARPECEELLPSSSLFRSFPAKLDLMLQDLSLYFGIAVRVFDRFTEEEASGPAQEEAAREWRALARGYYAPRLEWSVHEDGSLRVNAYCRLALNVLSMHRAMLRAYEEVSREPSGTLPLAGFRDLLVLGVSVFFEADRRRNLWRIDEYLSTRFVPLCRRMAAADRA